MVHRESVFKFIQLDQLILIEFLIQLSFIPPRDEERFECTLQMLKKTCSNGFSFIILKSSANSYVTALTYALPNRSLKGESEQDYASEALLCEYQYKRLIKLFNVEFV